LSSEARARRVAGLWFIILNAVARSSFDSVSTTPAELRARRIGSVAGLADDLTGTRRDVKGRRALLNRNPAAPAEFCPRRVIGSAPPAPHACVSVSRNRSASAAATARCAQTLASASARPTPRAASGRNEARDLARREAKRPMTAANISRMNCGNATAAPRSIGC